MKKKSNHQLLENMPLESSYSNYIYLIIKFSIYTLLTFFIFWESIDFMIKWWANEDYNYCYLIPPLVAYLIWENRKTFNSVPAMSSWAGLAPLLVGIVLFWLGELGGEYYTLYVAAWMVLVGLLWLHLGWAKLRTIIIPICFLVAMFPPPNFIAVNITMKLKLLSSHIGVLMMQAFGMSAYREGNIIDLGFTQLQVVDACSGLRYLFPMIILGFLLAYLHTGRRWKKALIVCITVPVTIFINSLRIAITGLLSEIWGPKVAEGFFHGFSGFFIFTFGLAVLVLILWGLDRVFKESSQGLDGDTNEVSAAKPASENLTENQAVPLRQKGFGLTKFAAAVLLLGTTLGFSTAIDFREQVPLAGDLQSFPIQIDTWTGRRQTMEDEFIKELDFSDYLMADYADRGGRSVNFYVAYYASQRKGESIHTPDTCMPSSGWAFKKAEIRNLTLKDGTQLPFKRAVMEKNGLQQLTYYWFPMRGRVLTNLFAMKFFTFWDALTRQRTDGALVRVITPVYPTESLEQAETRLQDFTRSVVPVLNEFLPK